MPDVPNVTNAVERMQALAATQLLEMFVPNSEARPIEGSGRAVVAHLKYMQEELEVERMQGVHGGGKEREP